MQVTVNTSCASVARTIALFHFYDTFIIHTKPKLLEFKTVRRTIRELHSLLKVEYWRRLEDETQKIAIIPGVKVNDVQPSVNNYCVFSYGTNCTPPTLEDMT